MLRSSTLFAACLLAALVAPSWAETRIRPGFNLFTTQQDVQIGAQSAAEVDRTVPLLRGGYPARYNEPGVEGLRDERRNRTPRDAARRRASDDGIRDHERRGRGRAERSVPALFAERGDAGRRRGSADHGARRLRSERDGELLCVSRAAVAAPAVAFPAIPERPSPSGQPRVTCAARGSADRRDAAIGAGG